MASDPTPLTQEQLAFLTEQTQRAATKASRAALRRYVRGATVAFTVMALAIGGSFYAQGTDSSQGRTAIVQSGRAVAVDGCNRDFKATERFRNLLLRGQAAQKRARADGDITQRQYELGREFYKRELRRTPLPDCRDALRILTDDPNVEVRVPPPLYSSPPKPPHGNH